MKSSLRSLRHVLAGLLALMLVMTPVLSAQVQAAGERYKAYMEEVPSVLDPTRKASKFFVETENGSVQTFCLNADMDAPIAKDTDVYNQLDYYWRKKDFGVLTGEAVAEFNQLIGKRQAERSAEQKSGEDLRRWLIAVLQYYDSAAYQKLAGDLGIPREDMFYTFATQQAVWKITDQTRRTVPQGTKDIFVNQIVLDEEDRVQVKQLLEQPDETNPLMPRAKMANAAFDLCTAVTGLAAVSEYDAAHTILSIYIGRDVSVPRKTMVLQNLYTVRREQAYPATISKRIINLAGVKTPNLLEGAKLTLSEVTGENTEIVVESFTTSKDADKSFNLYPGTYVLREEDAEGADGNPAGFAKAVDIRFVVGEDGSITFAAGNISKTAEISENTVIMYDEMKEVPVKISKQDITNSAELPGAKLQVLERGVDPEKVLQEWISGNEPHLITLGQGAYTLREWTAPDGYLVAESINFDVDAEGKIICENMKDGVIVMKDAPTKVTISKRDITNGEEIHGADLTVTDEAGNVVDSWKSVAGQSHQITGLVAGKVYTLTEVTAPDGYLVAESISFKLDQHNKVFLGNENGEWKEKTDGVVVMEDCREPEIVKQVNHKEPHENLGAKDEVFTYTIKTEIPKMPGLETFEVIDELNPILTFAGAPGEITVLLGEGDTKQLLNEKAVINGQTLTVRLTAAAGDLTKEVQGKKLTVEFKARIIDTATEKQIAAFAGRKVPNQARYVINNGAKTKWSNTVTVTPPDPKKPKSEEPKPEEPKPEVPTTPTPTPPTPTTPVTPGTPEVLGATRTPADTQIVATPTVLGSKRAANSPETGDGAPVRLLMALMGVGAAGAFAGVMKMRKMR